jgi:uncharacterized membrane protein YccC
MPYGRIDPIRATHRGMIRIRRLRAVWRRRLAHLSKSLPVQVDLRAVSIAEGLRAALATAVLVALSEFVHEPEVATAAIAAFWVCLADPGGTVERRLATMGLLTAAGTLFSGAAVIAGTFGLAVTLPLTFACSFATSYVRVFTPRLALVGQLVSIAYLVSLSQPSPELGQALLHGLMFAAGGVWAMILTLAIWRIRPEQPARTAVARCYHLLADYAGDLRSLVLARNHNPEAWGALARRHRSHIREAIEAARGVLLDTRRLRYGGSRRGEQRVVLLQTSDNAFADLIALNDMLEHAAVASDRQLVASRTLVGLALRRVQMILQGLADAIDIDQPPRGGALDDAIDGLRRASGIAGEGEAALLRSRGGHLFADLVQCIDLALAIIQQRNQTESEERPKIGPAAQGARANLRLFATLRDNLSFSSLNFRHSLRVAVTIAIGELLTRLLPLNHGYWLTVTATLIMQPSFGTTWLRAIERVAGSVTGSAFAAALGLIFQSPLAVAIALFPLTALTMAMRTVNYTLYIFFLTPQFVLVAGLGDPGANELMLTVYRVVDTLIGGALALAGSLLLWPSWEPAQLPRLLSAAIRANGQYLSRALVGPTSPQGDLEPLRREAGIASNNAEASLQRLAFEPATDLERQDAALVLVTSLRRMTGSTIALALLPTDFSSDATADHRARFATWAEQTLAGLAEAIVTNGAPPPLAAPPSALDSDPGQDQVTAIELQLQLMHDAASRYAGKAERPSKKE